MKNVTAQIIRHLNQITCLFDNRLRGNPVLKQDLTLLKCKPQHEHSYTVIVRACAHCEFSLRDKMQSSYLESEFTVWASIFDPILLWRWGYLCGHFHAGLSGVITVIFTRWASSCLFFGNCSFADWSNEFCWLRWSLRINSPHLKGGFECRI